MSKKEISDLIVEKLRSSFLKPKTELELRPSKIVENDPRWLTQKEWLIKSYELLAEQVLKASNAEIRKNIRIEYGTKMAYCDSEFEDPQSIERFSYVIYWLTWRDQVIPIESFYRIYSPFSNCPASQSSNQDARIVIESNTDLLWDIANTNYRPKELSSSLVNTFDRLMGNYPLTLAIAKGQNHHHCRRQNQRSQKEIIEKLLPYADMQLREFRYGLTPLEIAIMRGDDIDFIEHLFNILRGASNGSVGVGFLKGRDSPFFKLSSEKVPENLETLLTLDYDTVKIRVVRMTSYNTSQTYEKCGTCTISSHEIFLQNREKIRLFFKKYIS